MTKNNDIKRNREENFRQERKEPIKDQKEERFTDDIPLDDLKINMKQERKKHKTQDTSQSEKEWES